MCKIGALSYTKEHSVRTNIEIDEQLMARAMELTGLPTKRAVVDAALRALIERRSRQLLRESFGKYPWEGDLDQMRGRIKRGSA
jgi:Arc/MetJ family transcription regulator